VELPKLLVATEFPPNAPGGGPAVIRQMLKDWPSERLFWWSCLPERDQRFGQKVAVHRVATIPTRLYPNRRLSRLKGWVMEKFWAPRAAHHLKKTIAHLKLDVVWAIPHLWAIPPLAAVLPQGKTGFHTTIQDYPDANSQVGRLGNARASRLAALSDLIYSSSPTCDATSHPMLDDLAARTGKPGQQMLHAGLDREDFDWLEHSFHSKDHGIRIAYAGTIVVEKDFSLFIEALKGVREGLPEPLALHFFGYHSYRSRPWFDSSWMQEHGNLPDAELKTELRKCTWGFAPMALNDDDPRYNRFSFPTKFISYLAAGLPVITMGHPESSVIKLAAQYHVGPCITTANIEFIKQQLIVDFPVKNPAKHYGSAILACVRAEFDADRMRGTLRDCFETCARGPKPGFIWRV
jgi:hypothetical protein